MISDVEIVAGLMILCAVLGMDLAAIFYNARAAWIDHGCDEKPSRRTPFRLDVGDAETMVREKALVEGDGFRIVKASHEPQRGVLYLQIAGCGFRTLPIQRNFKILLDGLEDPHG